MLGMFFILIVVLLCVSGLVVLLIYLSKIRNSNKLKKNEKIWSLEQELKAVTNQLEITNKQLDEANTLAVIEFQSFCREQSKLYKEISDQKEHIEAQSMLLEEVNDDLRTKNKNVTDSIMYAKLIQNAILPAEEIIKSYLKEYFILYIPKSIVSGDFYWVKKSRERIFIAAVDCTGHGVPGAFMSLIANNILEQVVAETSIDNAGQILDLARQLLINKLTAEDNPAAVNDGMDITLVMIDPDNKFLQYAGAYNPLVMVKNGELIEYRADRMPVGKSLSGRIIPFRNHIINYENGDTIYMFTDGFHDQFGGQDNRKFSPARLKELLLQISDFSMTDQVQTLNSTFDEWKGESEQLDDILVVGVRL